jgi:cytochrome c oxidase cbb3-type subunit I/II
MELERFTYDDDIVRKFVVATLLWGLVGMSVGLLIACQLFFPALNFGEMFTFGRLRPLHTNAVIFAFAGNAIFAGVYYSSQRLLKARMFNDSLSRFHFWGWQAIIVSVAVTLPLGITQAKEYAEMEWPIDVAIAVVWVVFAINFFGTLFKRRERHIYVAIWFYIASIVTVALLHIFNNLVLPAGFLKSYSVYAGVQDAFMQWWYGHNAVAFVLTTPFLGLMYYFMPKAAERPVYSYRLSILHFWSLIFIYIWAGPHHLHYTALPVWASTLGMVFSLMLWMPSWGGMINGLLTLRGAWHKVAEDPVLKFMVVAVTFYGMSTFEGPLLSIKSVNALSHYTDWTIAHVHSGGLGWNGFLTFGMIYWLVPRLFQAPLHSKRLMNMHFWLGTIGILVYIVSIYAAGLQQGLMWRAFSKSGMLAYPNFIETVMRIIPMYWFRAIGGSLYILGVILCIYNVFRTWQGRPKQYDEPEHEAAALQPLPEGEDEYVPTTSLTKEGAVVHKSAHALERLEQAAWHRKWERLPVKFTVMTTLAVVVASLFEIVPTFMIKSNVPTIKSVKPFTPLEFAGRDIYIREGCVNCHSQMVRPLHSETLRYGEYSKPGEFVYEHPFLWGSRRIGPDLQREGTKKLRRGNHWHYKHMRNPRELETKSIMPAYPWMLTKNTDYSTLQARLRTMKSLGVPYTKKQIAGSIAAAKKQAFPIALEISIAEDKKKKGETTKQQEKRLTPAALKLADKQVIALIAYLQRLGTDIKKLDNKQPTALK